MTDRWPRCSALVHSGHALADAALERFHACPRRRAGDRQVVRAAGPRARPRRPGAAGGAPVAAAPRLLAAQPEPRAQPAVRLCRANPAAFHRADAAGYVFWADRLLELDAINPQLAGRLARVMDRWGHLAEPYRSAAREAIARVAAKTDLSNDVREIVTRALAD